MLSLKGSRKAKDTYGEIWVMQTQQMKIKRRRALLVDETKRYLMHLWRLKDGLINRHAKKAKTSKLQKCFWIEKGQRCAFKQNDEWEKVFFAERPKSVSPEFSGLNEAQADASSHLMRDMAAGSRIFPDWKGSKFKSSFSF